MEWLFIALAVVCWLVYRGRKARKAENLRAGRDAADLATRLERLPVFQDPHVMRSAAPPARWVDPGETVTVGGFRIDCGMFYLGGVLPGQVARSAGNCVIDPKSKVAGSGLDQSGQTMHYWPSYASITPVARRTYLQWLASGRSDPSIGIGYVFLFFYGIERRLLLDGAGDEAPLLVEEVRRLLRIYGSNGSFRNYADRLLEAVHVKTNSEVERPQLSPDLRGGSEIPLRVRLYLGHKLGLREPLEAEDALLWVLSLPDTQLRTAATRCFPELVELWRQRFAALHPSGLKVAAPKARLKHEYRSASGGFNSQIGFACSRDPIPDIGNVRAPVAGLRDLLFSCCEDLGAYSRLLGKKPDARGTSEAALLLPKELLANASSSGAGLLARVEAIFDGQRVAGTSLLKLAEVLSIDLGDTGKVSASIVNQIGSFLDRLEIGFEPDRRYGARNLQADGYVVLFKAPEGGKVDGSAPVFSAARRMTEVAALAAGADGRIERSEIEAIKAEIRAIPGLDDIEGVRLLAYAGTLAENVPAQQSATQKLKSLGRADKEAVIRSATSAILADGHASPDEVRFLERLHKTLGLPEDQVYATLHRGAVVVDEPVVVAPERHAGGVPIPAPPSARAAKQPSAGLQFDESRLARLKTETSAVSELLAGIFVEEETQPAQVPAPAAPGGRFEGLDAAHSELLSSLFGGGIGREEFEAQARGLRLLADGAIERINDWGFDTFGEALIDDGGDVTVAAHLRTQLMEAQTT